MPDDRHIPSEWYYLVAQGRLPTGTLAARLVQHLQEHCPECREACEALGDQQVELRRLLTQAIERDWQVRSALAAGEEPAEVPATVPPGAPGPGEGSSRYTSAFDRAARSLDEEAAALRQRRITARHDLKALLRVPPRERRRRIDRANTRFRTRSFAELLLEESRQRVRSSPAEAADLADLVPAALQWIPGAQGSTWGEALRARARAHHANALRVAGELARADRELATLRRDLEHGPVDPATAIDLDGLEASLRIDQRRFEEAGRLLDHAVHMSRNTGLDDELGRLLVKRAELRRQQDRLDEALDDVRTALRMIDPWQDQPLYLCALGTLALVLCDADRLDEAAGALEQARRWGRGTEDGGTEDDWWALRFHTVEGRIAFGRGSLDEAKDHFAKVSKRSRQLGLDLDAAVAALDLALVHLAAERAEAACACAQEGLDLCCRLDIDRDGMAAVALLDQAVRRKRLDRVLLGRVRSVFARSGAPRRVSSRT